MKINAEEIQMSNAASLTALGRAAIGAGDTIFDFSSVSRCDSSAVAMLLEWQRIAAAANVTLSFESLPESLTQLAELYGLQDIALPAAVFAAQAPDHPFQHSS